MASTQIKRDIEGILKQLLPNISQIPKPLSDLATSIYLSSQNKMILKSLQEPARLWLASWLAAER
jgi:hypothetical protein